MNKIIKLVSVIFLTLLLTGCGKEEKEVITNCKFSSNVPSSNYSLNSTYTVYSKDDVVNKVVTEEIVTSENEDILEYFKEYLNKTYSAQNDTYGGVTNEVKVEDGKVISSTTIDYNKMDLDKYVEDNSALNNYVNDDNRLTTEGVVSIYKALGAVCG